MHQRIMRLLAVWDKGGEELRAAVGSRDGLGISILAALADRSKIIWSLETDAVGTVTYTEDCWTLSLRKMKSSIAGRGQCAYGNVCTKPCTSWAFHALAHSRMLWQARLPHQLSR